MSRPLAPRGTSALTTPISPFVSCPRMAPSGPRALLLLLLAILLVASSCADTPLAPQTGRARAANSIPDIDDVPPLACPAPDDSLLPPSLQAPTTAEAGTIAGSFSVSPTGEAVYSIPLLTPPGRAGLQPSLAITYDSGGAAAEGPLGLGFSLTGLSAITRCPRNMADDGEIAPVRDQPGDPLCLDGKRLVPVDMPIDAGWPPYQPREYRTFPDTLSKIVTDLGEDQGWDLLLGPRGFTVYTRSGLIVDYGATPDSRVLSRGSVVRSWLVSRIRDRRDNTIDITWRNEQHPSEGYTVEHAPDRIEYTGHPQAPATRAVVFEYSRREGPEQRALYARGMALRRSLRLERIAMLAPAPTLVREYLFAYSTGPVTGRPLLDQIQECAADGACKPPTRFLWRSGGSAGFTEIPTEIDAPLSPRGSLMTLDATGDGLDDLLVSDVDMTGGQENALTNWILTPNRTAEISASYFESAQQALQQGLSGAQAPIQPELGTPIDYNQDGRMDVFVHDVYALRDTWKVLLAQPDGTFAVHDTGVDRPFPLGSPPPLLLQHPEASAHLADVDGDGVSDLVQCEFNGTEHIWRLHRWTPAAPGFEAAGTLIEDLLPVRCDTELHTVDVDADGKVDLVVPEITWTSNGAIPGNDFDALSYVHWNHPWTRTPLKLPRPQGRVLFLDVNGDGLPDAVETGFSDRQPRTYINTGAGFEAAVDSLPAPLLDADRYAGIAVPIDANADGLQDLLLPMVDGGNLPEWKLLQSTGTTGPGTFEVLDTALPLEVQLVAGDPPTLVDPRSPRVTDVDGDGLQDVLLTISSKVRVYKSTLHEEDLLAGVIDGMAAREPGEPGFRPRVEIDYGHLVDLDRGVAGHPGVPPAESRTYLVQEGSEPDDCAYPLRCVVGPRRVVSGYRLDTGAAQPRRFALAYREARYHRLGRGFLGFRARIVRDLDTGSGTAEYFDNFTWDSDLDAFPFAGQLLEEHRWSPTLPHDGQPGKGPIELRYTWIIPHAVETLSGRSWLTLPVLRSERREQGEYDPQSGRSVEEFVRATEGGGAESLGTTLHVVSEVDEHGNVLSESTSTAAADHETQVTRVVHNDEEAWLLGRVQSLTECSTAGGLTQCRTTSQTHDAAGQIKSQRAGSDDGDPETELNLTYLRDTFGNITGVVAEDAFGDRRDACVHYDAEGLFPVVSRNAEGHVARVRVHPGLGVPTAARDPNGRVTRWERDAFGRVTRELRPDGTETSYSLTRTKDGGVGADEWNLELRIQQAGLRDDTLQHDTLGRPVRWWTQGVQLGNGPTPRIVQEIGFDALGEHVAWRTTPHADPQPPNTPVWVHSYQYDGMGRVVRHVTPWLAETTTRYDGAAVVITRPGGATTRTENDALGRPTRIFEPEGAETRYTYGPFGGLWSVTDAGGAVTTTERDAYGRVRRQEDPDRGESVFHYNGFGELTSSLDAEQREVLLARDRLGRLVQRTDADGVTTFRWDSAPHAIGQIAQVESPDGHLLETHYDAFGRVQETALTVGGETFTVGVTYDALGRTETITYPEAPGVGGFVVRHDHDDYGHLIAVRDHATGAPFWEAQSADAAGRIRVESFGGGAASTTRSYFDDRDRLHGVHTEAGGAVVQELSYEYDARLNLMRREDGLQGKQEIFSHDSLDRLTCVRTGLAADCAQAFAYAPNGNLLTKSGSGDFTYDPAHPHAVSTAGAALYGYDAVGNQISRPGAHISYTAFDLPREITLQQGGTITFDYDGLGGRIRKTTLDVETLYVGGLYERVTHWHTGQVEHRYHVASAERVVAVVRRQAGAADEVRYLHVDALGSVDVVTDPSGAVRERRSYDAFGARRNPIWGAPTPPTFKSETTLGFTAHEADDELGLVNMKGRIYDPQLGRFLTPDPIIAHPYFSQGWNPYSYVLNSPVSHVDPTGFTEEPLEQAPGVTLVPVPPSAPWIDAEWEIREVPPGVQPPVPASPTPVEAIPAAAAPPPVDVGIWGNPAQAQPQPSPALEALGRGLRIHAEVGIGVGEGLLDVALAAGKFLGLNALTLGGYGTYSLGKALWRGYLEDGFLGVVNAVNPFYQFARAGVDSYRAAEAGDYRAAGRNGVNAAVIGATTAAAAGAAAEAAAARGAAAEGAAAAEVSEATQGVAAELTRRAEEIHSVLHFVAQKHRTTAVLRTNRGDIVASGVEDLRPMQRQMLRPGETAAMLAGEHAEKTALHHAHAAGLSPQVIGTNWNICPACKRAIEESGGRLIGPRAATWGP